MTMQAVILAAGEGKRMQPLTNERPKPLVPVLGKPLIEHIIEALPKAVDHVIVVIGYKGEMLQAHLGDSFNGRHITYVVQEKPQGTAHALLQARPYLTGTFLLMCGDDIHGARALTEAAQYPLAILAAPHQEPSKFGVIEKDEEGFLRGLEEKPSAPKSNLVSTGAMVLDERIFEYPTIERENGERYLTDQILALANDAPMRVVVQTSWIPIGYPEDILRAEKLLSA